MYRIGGLGGHCFPQLKTGCCTEYGVPGQRIHGSRGCICRSRTMTQFDQVFPPHKLLISELSSPHFAGLGFPGSKPSAFSVDCSSHPIHPVHLRLPCRPWPKLPATSCAPSESCHCHPLLPLSFLARLLQCFLGPVSLILSPETGLGTTPVPGPTASVPPGSIAALPQLCAPFIW